jgi:hypothetical protein
VEDSWRQRLEKAQGCYRQATAQYRELLREYSQVTPDEPDGALALARREESEALAEYIRVLRLFTELTVKGQMPEER